MRRGKLQPALPRPTHPGSRGRHLPGDVTFVCTSAGLPFTRGLATAIGDSLACAGMEFPGMAGLSATKEAFVHAGAESPVPSAGRKGQCRVRLRRHKSSIGISPRESSRRRLPARARSSRFRPPMGKANAAFACADTNLPSRSVREKVATLIRPCGRGVPDSVRR